MDKIILGLLLNQPMTGYKIRSSIQAHFSMMCSDSAGSIQTAIKKLLEKGFINCEEFFDGEVHKKRYSITDGGRTAFHEWEGTPMNHRKSKNLELAKLYFMDNVDSAKRTELIAAYLRNVTADLHDLQELYRSIMAKVVNSNGDETDDGIQFRLHTLKYGIDLFRFEQEWYERLLDKIKGDSVRGTFTHPDL